MPRKTIFKDLGTVDYQKAWDMQTELHNELKEKKLAARKANLNPELKHYLLFVEHNHVYTLGKSGKIDHLIYNEKELSDRDIQFHKINRGGDITYHGKGQLTIYPIFDMDDFYHDVHKYVRDIEEVIIQILDKYSIRGYRRPEYTGVWVKDGDIEKKICAIGIHLSRWVSMHGLAFNVNTDLSYFEGIIPCGISEKTSEVCSLQSLLKQSIDLDKIKEQIKDSFQSVFDLVYIQQ